MVQLQCSQIPSLQRYACTPSRVLLSVLLPWLAASFLLSDVAAAGRKDIPGGRLRGSSVSGPYRRQLQEDPATPTPSPSPSSPSLTVWIVIGGSVLVALAVVATIAVVLWQKRKPKPSAFDAGLEAKPSGGLSVAGASGDKGADSVAAPEEPAFVPEVFDLKTLEALTNNWDPKQRIEDAGWSSVYSALMEGVGKVAIKRAKKESKNQRNVKFDHEVKQLAKTRHPNLVPFIGSCSENLQQIVVFEFIPNGPLSAWLRPNDGREPLPFATRVSVAVDVAQALAFVHSRSPPIVHKDVKTSSILLRRADGGYRALLGSLGVVKHMDEELSVRLERKRRYLDPEFSTTMKVPLESDVYSFGVVLLELITGRAADLGDASGMERGQAPPLVDWALPLITKKDLEAIMDPRMPDSSGMLGPVKELASIAVFCLTPKRTDRPKMQQVLQRLTAFQQKFSK